MGERKREDRRDQRKKKKGFVHPLQLSPFLFLHISLLTLTKNVNTCIVSIVDNNVERCTYIYG